MECQKCAAFGTYETKEPIAPIPILRVPLFCYIYRMHQLLAGFSAAAYQKKWQKPLRRLTKVFASLLLQVIPCFLASTEGFAPAGATRGLSDRPLDSFGPRTCETSASSGGENSFSQRSYEKLRFFSRLSGRSHSASGCQKTPGRRRRAAAPPTSIRIRRLCRLKVGFSKEKPSRFATAVFHAWKTAPCWVVDFASAINGPARR